MAGPYDTLSDEELDAEIRRLEGGRLQPAMPRVIPLPQTPSEQREEARRNRGEGREDTRIGLSQADEGRAQRNERFDNAKNLRDEFYKLPDVQDYRAAVKAYATALKTSETPAGDLNLIYAFAKIMDPNSVVREGEQAAVAGGDSLSGQITARLKKELDGDGTFRPEYRNQLRRELQTRVSELNKAYNGQRAQYTQFATEMGVDPKVVIGEHDGKRFYDDVKAYYESKGHKVVDSATDASGKPLPFGARVGPKDKMGPTGGYRDSLVGQGMSGVNEGIADTLGLPVDLATAALNLAPRGINALTNSRIPTIENPVLGGEWLKQKMGGWGIYEPSADPTKQFTRRVGQSVGAATVPMAGAGSVRGALGGVASAAGGGAGAAAAQQAFPGNPLAEFAGEVAGSGLTGRGLLGASQYARQRAIESQVPTVEQLKEQASELYRTAEARGVTATPDMTRQLARDLRTTLRGDGRISPTGRISEVYPKAKEAMQLVTDYSGKPMTPTQMQTVRKVMADGLNSPDATERRTANMLTDIFDQWTAPQAPELAQAREISSRYLNAQKLEQARELAGAKASQFSGSGFENALRTEYRALDRAAIKGKGRYGEDVTNSIERVSRGTPASNFARDVGKLYPSGVVSLGLGTGMPAAIGTMIGGPAVGAAAGATSMGLGLLGRGAATQMGTRAADVAELTARNGGLLDQAPLLIPEETDRIIRGLLAAQAGQYLGY